MINRLQLSKKLVSFIIIIVIFFVVIISIPSTSNAQTNLIKQEQNPIIVWNWHQPPFEIYYDRWGMPFPNPYVTITMWGGENENTIFAYTEKVQDPVNPKGLYRSRDSGSTWDYLGTIDENETASVLVSHPITPTLLLAGFERSYYQGGIYRSEDFGESWDSVLPYVWVYDIEFDPINPNIVYATVLSSVAPPSNPFGIYRSEDTGKTWVRVSDLCLGDIEVYPIDNRFVFGARYFSTNDNEGIYQSPDKGETWEQIAHIGGQKHLLLDPFNPEHFIAFGRDYSGIWSSADRGVNWVDITNDLPIIVAEPSVLSAVFDPTSPNVVWIGLKYDGIFQTTNSGENWQAENNGIFFFGGSIFGPQCTSLAINSSGRLATTCNGFFILARNWTKQYFSH